MTCRIEAGKVGGIVAEVGVHLKHILIVALQSPTESGDIRRAQAQLAAALHQKQPAGKLLRHQTFHNAGSAVWRTVVDDEYVKRLLQAKHRPDDLLDVLLFIISGYDYYAVAHILLIL